MRYALALLAAMTLAVPMAHASSVDHVDQLSQSQFRGLSEDLGGVLSYKQLQPSAPEGTLGFSLGVDASYTRIRSDAAWKQATGSSVSGVPTARIRASKGLPFGFDVGAFYSTVPGSNINAFGAELRYALVQGGPLTPAVGIRGSYTRLDGVSQLHFNTRALDLSVSKGFAFLTPYAGVGRVWVHSTPEGSAAQAGLHEETLNQSHVFGGVRLSLIPASLTLEIDRTGSVNTYSAKLGFGF
ncbi:MAG TPA: hypothetical protein VFA86_01795 [Gammaproteobacteria bacterium]|nr:hypothetical protein [Gammaproteobacteria bacterium]